MMGFLADGPDVQKNLNLLMLEISSPKVTDFYVLVATKEYQVFVIAPLYVGRDVCMLSLMPSLTPELFSLISFQ